MSKNAVTYYFNQFIFMLVYLPIQNASKPLIKLINGCKK